MFARIRPILLGCIILTAAGMVAGQGTPLPAPKVEPPPPRDQVAARVNGQAIPELAVYRGSMRVPAARRDETRKDVLNYLIDNTIIDQYLLQLKIPVEAKEVDEHIEKIKKEALEIEKKKYEEILKELMVTEDELRAELTSALRWDKFVIQQGTDKVLQDFFKANVEMFNSSKLRARHILIPVADGKKDAAQIKLAAIKKGIDDEVGKALDKIGKADAITLEKERTKALEKAFADAAVKNSTCPSSKDGGDLGEFPRVGAMVEPFARAAFALKPYQVSEPVATEFGYHLILAVEFKAGKDVKFEDKNIKAFVQEVYGERLREAVLSAYKPKAKIDIVDRKK